MLNWLNIEKLPQITLYQFFLSNLDLKTQCHKNVSFKMTNYLFILFINSSITFKKKMNRQLFNRRCLQLLHLTVISFSVILLHRLLDQPPSSISSVIVFPQLYDDLSQLRQKSVSTISLSSVVDDLPQFHHRRSPSTPPSKISLSFIVSYSRRHQGISYLSSSSLIILF